MRTHAALQAAAAIGVAVAALATQLQGQLPSQGSAGCRLRVRTANMPVPRDLTRRTLKVGETERELFVHIPDTCRGKAAPVVFALHGGSASSGLAMHLKLELAPVAVREGFVVVCPSGTENCSREGGRTCASGRRLRRRRRPPEPRIAAHVAVRQCQANAAQGGDRRAAPGRATVEEDDRRRRIARRAGRGQLFESICVAGLTDIQGGMNGVAIVDLNKDGLLDIVATHSAARGTGGAWGAGEKLRVFINEGGFRFRPHTIKLLGSNRTGPRGARTHPGGASRSSTRLLAASTSSSSRVPTTGRSPGGSRKAASRASAPAEDAQRAGAAWAARAGAATASAGATQKPARQRQCVTLWSVGNDRWATRGSSGHGRSEGDLRVGEAGNDGVPGRDPEARRRRQEVARG